MEAQWFNRPVPISDALQRAEWRRFNMFTVAPLTFEEYQKTSERDQYFSARDKEEKK